MKKSKNFIGKKFGIFTVIKDYGYVFATENSKTKTRKLIVKCEKCLHEFQTTLNSISRMSQNNCKQKHQTRNNLKVTKEWTRMRHIRQNMISRCYKNFDHRYKYYGAKKIMVCEEWFNSMQAFYDWSLQNGYKNNLTIDRIDNDKGYYPDNCRWVSLKEQSRNKSVTISIEKVKEIKKLLNKGYTNHIIANMLNTSKSRVDDISSGRSWQDVDL